MSAQHDDCDLAPHAYSDSSPITPQTGKEAGHADRVNPDSSVISVKTFRSAKGNVYKIIKTNEVDSYRRPVKLVEDSE